MMNDFIEIIQRRCTTDEEAFSSNQDVVLASVRAEKSISGSVSGVGSLTWKGAATEVSTNVSGIGRVSKG